MHKNIYNYLCYNNYMKTDSKTIFFYIVLATCSLALLGFTALTTMSYSINLAQGYITSALVFFSYPLILHKSHIFFTQNRVGLAYFLVICSFLILAFVQMMGCANSMRWEH